MGIGVRKHYTLKFSKDKLFFQKLYRLIGYVPTNTKLYKLAFVHNSNSVKDKKLNTISNNERLEFLGDAVLDLIIADLLFKKFPFQGEGFLTEMRSKCVSRKSLATIALNMGLQELISIDSSIAKNRGAIRGISGNAFEALIGAIYLDKGYTFTQKFVKSKIVGSHLDFDSIKEKVENYKSILNQWSQKERKDLEYRIIEEKGKNHQKLYTIGVFVDQEKIATAQGKSKKVAEQLASEIACTSLQLID